MSDLGYASKLEYFVKFAGYVFTVHFLVFIYMGFNFGAIIFDAATEGLYNDQGNDVWNYIRIYGAIWGLIGLGITIWIFNNTWRSWRYWVALIIDFLSCAWLIVCSVSYISDWSNCNSVVHCVGNGRPGTVSTAWIIHSVFVWVSAVVEAIYVGFILYLRFRVQFAGYLALAASPGSNPTLTSVTPPGTMSALYNTAYAGKAYSPVSLEEGKLDNTNSVAPAKRWGVIRKMNNTN